jgi:deoxyadenosine/deoxycytidine kinase
MQREEPFIMVAGNIGTGKTTVVEILAERLRLPAYFEGPDRNPFFARLYGDPATWSFRSQLAFLTSTLKDHAAITRSGHGAVTDRGIDEMHRVFTAAYAEAGFIGADEHRVLDELVTALESVLVPPDLLVFVHAPVDELLARIRNRGRPEEAGLDAEYLLGLERRYEAWLAAWAGSPVLRVDTTVLDPRFAMGAEQLVREVEGALRRRPRTASGG